MAAACGGRSPAGRWLAASLVMLAPIGAFAQDRPFTPGAMLDAVAGRTATMVTVPGNVVVGIERFIDRTRSVYARPDGSCMFGRITVDGSKLCFAYDDAPGTEHCWLPFRADGEMFAVSTATGGVQRIANLDESPVDCEVEPLS